MSSQTKRTVVSNETRGRVVDFVFNRGMTLKQTADLLKLKKRTVYGICSTFTNENRIEKKRKSGRKVAFDHEFERLVSDFFKLNNDATTKECINQIRERPDVYGERVPSITTIDRILKKQKVTMKNLELIPVARNSKETIEKRFEYITKLFQFENSGWEFIYVDEFGCNLHTSRKRGRNSIGKPATKTTPSSRGGNLSTCAAISHSKGVLHFRSKFCSYNNSEFVAFLDELAEKLNKELKFKIIMDNVSFHKHDAVKNWFKKHQDSGFKIEQFFLPPYSPMLNPIEECFSKIHFSVASAHSQDSPSLVQSVRTAFSEVTVANCIGWNRHTRAYHDQCLWKLRIEKQANSSCPAFRVEEIDYDTPDDSEDELIAYAIAAQRD